jgi:CDP-glucose 4,6-dehydratase
MLHDFYRNKNILITGHTGFKGSWLALWLTQMGAHVFGIAQPVLTSQDHFVVTQLQGKMDHRIADIRDLNALQTHMQEIRPEIIFHLAAQPIVLDSYENPVDTFSTNIMGTIHVLEAARLVESVKTMVIVTTDKCYENQEWQYAYRENDALGGHDPYSASKAAAEVVSHAFYRSFLQASGVGLATARAGNVIGGGDWQAHRLIPDLMRAVQQGETLEIRNPASIRPWQHVLEPLHGYLQLGRALSENRETFAGAWNFGPSSQSAVTVEQMMNYASKYFKDLPVTFASAQQGHHEAQLLQLDSSKAAAQLGWSTVLGLEETIKMTIEWYQALFRGDNLLEKSTSQIQHFEELKASA